MGNALTTTQETVDSFVTRVFFKGLDQDTLQQTLLMCQRYDLDPLLKHVVVIRFGNRTSPYITRDGLLHVAHQSGKLDGMSVTYGKDGIGEYAECTVHRKDASHPFVYRVYRDEYDTKQNTWKSHPRAMLTKTAEVFALRRAFDVSMSAYEEMDTAISVSNGEVIEGTYSEPKPAQKQAQIPTQVQTTTQPVETPVAPNSPAQVAIVANTAKPTREPMNVETLLSTFADRIEKQHAADDANKALVGDEEVKGKDSISAQFRRFLGEACKTTISDKTQVLFYQALFGDSVDSSKKMTLGMWTVLDQWMNSKVNRSVAMQEAAALFDHLMKPVLAQTA